MSKRVDITKKQINDLKKKGFTIVAIAKKLGCGESTIYNILKDAGKEVHTDNCKVCGKEYTYIGNIQRSTCGEESCTKKHKALIQKEDRKQDLGNIREYTETTIIMIVQDIEKGRSVTEMAEMYNRDQDDVKRLINKIIADGTIGRVKRMLSAYKNSNTLRKGGSVRLL